MVHHIAPVRCVRSERGRTLEKMMSISVEERLFPVRPQSLNSLTNFAPSSSVLACLVPKLAYVLNTSEMVCEDMMNCSIRLFSTRSSHSCRIYACKTKGRRHLKIDLSEPTSKGVLEHHP